MPKSATAVAATPRRLPRRFEPPGVVEIPVRAVRVGPSLRERGIDRTHVATLADVAESWPPIVVSRSDYSVIDGQHRVAAARQLGLRSLRAELFDGSPDDAYVEFVRCNVGHGLPLTLGERRVAARRILRSHPDRSDRGIASVCGISPKTVARLREELVAGARRNGSSSSTKGRVGRDGRTRPLDALGARRRIREELRRRPDASLRSIANAVGASPETVRNVRNEVRAGRDVRARTRSATTHGEPEATVLGLLSRQRRTGAALRGDRAFIDCDGGQQFVAWFDATSVDPAQLWQHVGTVPLSRIYEIADEARRRAEFWGHFAEALEGRARCRA